MALKRKSARPLEAIEADLLLLLLRERYGYDFSLSLIHISEPTRPY